MRIGLDLDNTIIHYDNAFLTVAREHGLVPPDFQGGKLAVREHIRARQPHGDTRWQMLHGYVYGKGIGHARLFPGLPEFLHACQRQADVTVHIVSHKAEFGHFDPDRVNLRDAARDWLRERHFFDSDGFGLHAENVYFESTRADKVERIKMLACDWFVDDLPEVFEEPGFPANTRPVLFVNNGRSATPHAPWQECTSWDAIRTLIFAK